MQISVFLQLTKYDLVFMWHVVTANKFEKGVLCIIMQKIKIKKLTNSTEENSKLTDGQTMIISKDPALADGQKRVPALRDHLFSA